MMKFIARLALLLIPLLVLMPTGCAHVSPETTAQIQKEKDQTALKVQQTKDQAKVTLTKTQGQNLINDENGKNAPATHPIAAANHAVKLAEPIALAVAIISSILFAVSFGLSKTAYKFLAGLTPLFRWVAVLSWAAVLALPFLPWGAFIGVLALAGLIAYELIKNKGNIPETEADIEADLGIKTPATGPTPTPAKA